MISIVAGTAPNLSYHGPFDTATAVEGGILCQRAGHAKEMLPTSVIGEVWREGTVEEMPARTLTADELAVARAARWEEIKAFRDNRLDNGGYEAAGHWYNSDIRAKGEQAVLAGRADRIQLAGGDMDAQYVIGGENVQWKTMDNGYVPMTATLALAIRDAAEAMTVKTYKAAATHQYFLNLSADPANYDFSGGWPAIYGEV